MTPWEAHAREGFLAGSLDPKRGEPMLEQVLLADPVDLWKEESMLEQFFWQDL